MAIGLIISSVVRSVLCIEVHLVSQHSVLFAVVYPNRYCLGDCTLFWVVKCKEL